MAKGINLQPQPLNIQYLSEENSCLSGEIIDMDYADLIEATRTL